MLTANQSSTLAQLLAHTDALFNPFRWRGTPSSNAAAAIVERQAAFDSRGVPLVVAGGGTQRLAGERELHRLAADGLIELHYHGKRVGASLTDRGDSMIRKLTAGYLARESFPLLAEVGGVRDAFGGATNAGFVAEVDILGRDYDQLKSADLADLENQLLPLLCRGWLLSASDVEGRVGYAVTELGRAAVRPRAGKLPKYDPIVGDEYDELFQSALAEREAWQPSAPSMVAIPLSAGRWPRRPGALCDG